MKTKKRFHPTYSDEKEALNFKMFSSLDQVDLKQAQLTKV